MATVSVKTKTKPKIVGVANSHSRSNFICRCTKRENRLITHVKVAIKSKLETT